MTIRGARQLDRADHPIPAPEFRVAAQWGVEYPAGVPKPALGFPFLAQWTHRDTCLIVDRSRPVNRLLETDRGGCLIWSMSAPPRMNFAHRLDADRVLYTQGTALCWADGDGRCSMRRELPVSTAFNCGSVLGDELALGGDDGILLLGLDGRIHSHLRPDESSFIEPSDVQLLANGNILMVDALTTCAIELDRRGRRVAVFGQWRRPGTSHGRLGGPYSACRLDDGRTVVADWRAHRLATFDGDGGWLGDLQHRPPDEPAGPSYVRQTASGELLVAETINRRVSLRGLDGIVHWQFGATTLPRRSLSFPRTVEPLPASDDVLVCDTYHNRIVALGPDGEQRWQAGGAVDGGSLGLSLPRCAVPGRDGSIAIADGLNGRIVVLDPDGSVRRDVETVWFGGTARRLADPHFAELTDDGLLLVVDSDLASVLLIDSQDHVVNRWNRSSGLDLLDPHQARLRPDGTILIADSGNDRIVEVDRQGQIQLELRSSVPTTGGISHPLLYPRFADWLAGGHLLVVDTDACRITATSRLGMERWSVEPILDLGPFAAAAPELRVPKWASWDHRGRLLVADYLNSRVLALVHFGPDQPSASRSGPC